MGENGKTLASVTIIPRCTAQARRKRRGGEWTCARLARGRPARAVLQIHRHGPCTAAAPARDRSAPGPAGGQRTERMKLFLDITRLATRIFRSGPTGIDRVEYAYAHHLIDDPATICVFTAPVFSGAIRSARARDILTRVERAWRLDASAEDDASILRCADGSTGRSTPRRCGQRALQVGKPGSERLRDADFLPVRDILRAETRRERRVAAKARSRRYSSIVRTRNSTRPNGSAGCKKRARRRRSSSTTQFR